MAKILVIDDDLDYRDIVSEVLLGASYQVSTATDGEKGLEYVKNNNDIDLILLDLYMPNMDGLTFYYHLNNDLKRDIPVIILTNMTDTAYPQGIEDFIIKSDTDPQQLLDKVKSHLPTN